MAWILVETSNVAEKSELNFAGIMFRRAKGSGTTKALRNFEIVYLLDNGILGALGTSPSSSTNINWHPADELFRHPALHRSRTGCFVSDNGFWYEQFSGDCVPVIVMTVFLFFGGKISQIYFTEKRLYLFNYDSKKLLYYENGIFL